jgi:hypothetical protein
VAHSAQNFSPSLLPKKVISKLYKTLLVHVLDGRETWSFILRIGHRLGVLRTIGGGGYLVFSGKKWQESGENLMARDVILFYSSTNIIAIMK